jgi:TRAP-type uncharacterized transport system substrate-binding protein
MEAQRKTGLIARLVGPLTETFGLSRAAALTSLVLTFGVLFSALFWFFHSAPPTTMTISTGTAGSSFETNAIKYKQILARSGVTLKILHSEGSLQNLQRLNDPSSQVEVGFVQSGITNPPQNSKLVSLGSISYQPLMIFYRSATPLILLSEFKGKRLAIGPPGSGTRLLALTLLQLNGIEPGGETTLMDFDAEEAAKELVDGRVDGIFLMGDSAPPQLMRRLLLTPNIQILDFKQADGYTRRISYLNKLEFPMGSLDFGKNIPAHDVFLLGPTVELIARPELHPALCDLLLDAAKEVHGGASLLKRKGEFPALLAHDFPLSNEAERYYKSGKSFLYRALPFWLASVVGRVLVAFVPAVVLLIPGLRLIPTLLRMRVKLRLNRWYRALLSLERDERVEMPPDKRNELLSRLEHIELSVHKMKVPASYADQVYALRGYIGIVRERMEKDLGGKA